MAYDDEILGAAAAMDPSADAALLNLVSQAAGQELEQRLLAGISPESCKASFITAGAFLALAMVEAAAKGSGVGSFGAGDFSVTMASPREQSLRQQADRIIAPYVGDGFSFAGVEG